MLRCAAAWRAASRAAVCRAASSSSSSAAGAAASFSSFLRGDNAMYAEAMLAAWQRDPASVHASWDAYFRTGAFQSAPRAAASAAAAAASASGSAASASTDDDHFALKVSQLIRAYQVRGHFQADLDPLGISRHGVDRGIIAEDEFALEKYGLSEADVDRPVDVGVEGMCGFQDPSRPPIKLRELVQRLQDVYTRHIGVEYMHITDPDQCNWLRSQFETVTRAETLLDKVQTLRVLDRLTWADHFERFLAQKWSTAKRFGVEGAEALVPGMKELVDSAATDGCADVVIGMPHRGRLNVLANVVRKPLEQIFCEFSGGGDTSEFEGSGDVKYHLGMSFDRPVVGGGEVHLSLVANPSHLEAVNPVVMGKARAKLVYASAAHDAVANHRVVMPVLLHGDAAFSGQGVVYESMGLGDLPAYTVGGTVHIIVNNQIGFTTDPIKSRSSAYCSDLAKAFGAPVFHVNGDDADAVTRVCRIAALWRQKFAKDVVIDMVCYRKYGHNEIDEPMFTQPHMYTAIAAKKSPLELYTQQLVAERRVSEEEARAISSECNAVLHKAFEAAQKSYSVASDWLSSNWSGLTGMGQHSMRRVTGVDAAELLEYAEKLTTVPDGFVLHKRLRNVMKQRAKMFTGEVGFDWGTAEALAFATCLQEGVHVRLSGQDVERGTFSHRHAVLHHQTDVDAPPFVPLANLSDRQALFTVSNSSLSEYGVLGFELGYSLENPNFLVVFEAQFADFVNTAQVIIDQFISSGEAKWQRQSGLVMLLPHGFEGQGPEHSSGRLERFLQMSNDAEDEFPEMANDVRKQIQNCNWQVIMPSTPANYFHALRRQVHRNFRKPLMVFNPKSLLRHKRAVSTLDDMADETTFRRVLNETDADIVANAGAVRKLVLCSGKVYYDLVQQREQLGDKSTALVRVEQISPFPFDRVLQQAQLYANAEVVWAQEEPRNMGSWTYVAPRIETALKNSCGRRASYAGRPPAASPATGFLDVHKAELRSIMQQVFGDDDDDGGDDVRS